jgi:transposase
LLIQFFYHESAEACMRGEFADQGRLFSYISPEARVPANHPLRKVRELVRDVLGELNRTLSKLYASEGRPSIPPEQLLSALLLQVFYGIRSERQLMEQLDYNLLYRWFVGLSPDDPVWDPTVFTKNRDRLQSGEVFAKFMTKLLNHPQVKPLLSDEHFSVDGTLIEAWASHKSFRPKDGSGDDDGGANFHGQKRKNDTHASTTDPNSRLYRKAAGREAKLCYMGHVTMENRHGLAVAGMVTLATGTAERRASETMLKAKAEEAGCRITVGEDKAYDTADHVAHLRAINVTPHVTQNDSITSTGKHRQSAIDGRTTRHEGYGTSQSRRAMTECIFGWGKQHGTMRKTKHRGIAAVAADFLLNLIAYNLIRIPKLAAV